MNNREHQEYIKQLKAVTSKLWASKKASKAFYVSAGIHDENGQLTDMYVSESSAIGYSSTKKK